MGLRDINIKLEYRGFQDEIVRDFYIPLLEESCLYQRAVGFFSSTSLAEIAKGISRFVENGGKIQLVASPKLPEKDIEDIEKGYKLREEAMKQTILFQLNNPKNFVEEKQLSLLAELIADNVLDIKIAFMETSGIYHEKMGLFYDEKGDIVAFSGSMNESRMAMLENYETIDTFTSWTDGDRGRVENKKIAFEKIWNDEEKDIKILKFPELKKEILERYYKGNKSINEILEAQEPKVKYAINTPQMPEEVQLYEYQLDAIKKWRENKFRGIFDMATGSGKTFTGLGAICELSKFLEDNLFVIIVCPYQHLVEQWVEDIKKFNIKPIIGYSASPQRDWKDRLKRSIKKQNLKLDKFCCFICTNATFSSVDVQDILDMINGDKLLVVDEAHNFGSPRLQKTLNESYKYRLALSATLERHNDTLGTEKLYEFFGKKVIEYDLERAIKEGKLTPYKYYPILVYLDEEELEEYRNLSYEICKHIIEKDGKKRLDSYGEILAIERSRLIAGAKGKLTKLKEVITPYKDDNYMLVYCGATNVLDPKNDSSDTDKGDIRQIDAVVQILGNQLNMKVGKFTSNETIEERKEIKNAFENRDLQGLVAIKCLDEGVNIPNIKTAFILASTTNPKEYIQRRGRVLRKSKNIDKEYAEIYDFITLPRSLDAVQYLTLEQMKIEIPLVRKELVRIEEFGRLAINSIDARELIFKIKDAYKDNIQYLEEEDYNGCCED